MHFGNSAAISAVRQFGSRSGMIRQPQYRNWLHFYRITCRLSKIGRGKGVVNAAWSLTECCFCCLAVCAVLHQSSVRESYSVRLSDRPRPEVIRCPMALLLVAPPLPIAAHRPPPVRRCRPAPDGQPRRTNRGPPATYANRPAPMTALTS